MMSTVSRCRPASKPGRPCWPAAAAVAMVPVQAMVPVRPVGLSSSKLAGRILASGSILCTIDPQTHPQARILPIKRQIHPELAFNKVPGETREVDGGSKPRPAGLMIYAATGEGLRPGGAVRGARREAVGTGLVLAGIRHPGDRQAVSPLQPQNSRGCSRGSRAAPRSGSRGSCEARNTVAGGFDEPDHMAGSVGVAWAT